MTGPTRWVASLRLVAIVGREPDVHVLTRRVAGPAWDVHHERFGVRGLPYDFPDCRGPPLDSPRSVDQSRDVGAVGHGSPGVALFTPRITAIVIPVYFPEPRLVMRGELNPAHPLGALPEVEVRHEQPRGTAVLGCSGLPIVAERDPRFPTGDIRQAAGSSCTRRRNTQQ